MRHLDQGIKKQPYKIIAVDDEEGIIDSLSVFLKRSGYHQFMAIKLLKKLESLTIICIYYY